MALRRSQLRNDGDGLDLLIGDRPLTLPAPLRTLSREQLDLRPDADDDAWLFPGRRPGQPLDPQYLALRLRTLSTSLSALQNTARFRLAGAVPAKVLADMLDFSVATFENYTRLAGCTRGDYPALREAGNRQTTPQAERSACARCTVRASALMSEWPCRLKQLPKLVRVIGSQ